MPIFKSTYNILKKSDEDEVFNDNWMDTPFLQLPDSEPWDYSRELKIEDIDIWEVIVEYGGGLGVYAAWKPYAEFYLITTGLDLRNQWILNFNNYFYNYNDKFYESYYGVGAQEMVKKRAEELGIILPNSYIWVENDGMWLYSK